MKNIFKKLQKSEKNFQKTSPKGSNKRVEKLLFLCAYKKLLTKFSKKS
jgi:hypothetical protein